MFWRVIALHGGYEYCLRAVNHKWKNLFWYNIAVYCHLQSSRWCECIVKTFCHFDNPDCLYYIIKVLVFLFNPLFAGKIQTNIPVRFIRPSYVASRDRKRVIVIIIAMHAVTQNIILRSICS